MKIVKFYELSAISC